MSTGFALQTYWLSLPALHWAAQLPGVLPGPSGQMWLRDTFHSGWCCVLDLTWAWVDQVLGLAKLLIEYLNQADLHPAKSPGNRV